MPCDLVWSYGEDIRAHSMEAEEAIREGDIGTALECLHGINETLRAGAERIGYPHLAERP